MKHWTPKKVKSVRTMLKKVEELRKKQDVLFKEIEFQMYLAERNIDPHDIKNLKTEMQVHGPDVVAGVIMNDGTRHKISPPIRIPKSMVQSK